MIRIAGRYWLITAAGAGDPDIYAYPAPAPWGPFDASGGILLYRAPGIGLNPANDYRILYEARAEPALSTPTTLVISYNVNSEAVTGSCMSISHHTNAIIQPRFIAVPRTEFTQAGAGDQVLAARPDYPQILQRNPAQWYDAWSFAGGCPPVPGVSGLRAARTGIGRASLSWRPAGIGMRYRIYLGPGPGSRKYLRTVVSPHVTLTGLTSGLSYSVQVVPVSIHSIAGPAAETSLRSF